VLDVARFELARERRESFGAHSDPGELALGERPAGNPVLAHVLAAEPGTHLAAVARRDEVALLGGEPVAARRLVLAGDDLDDLAVGELVSERDDAPVHLGAAAAVPERGMDAVGEIEGRRPVRQVDHLALGREDVHPVGKEFAPHALDQVAVGVGARALLRLEEPAHPLDLALVRRVRRATLLVAPVRGDAEFGVLVHLLGADLHLDAL
jgi:hypothetical protein